MCVFWTCRFCSLCLAALPTGKCWFKIAGDTTGKCRNVPKNQWLEDSKFGGSLGCTTRTDCTEFCASRGSTWVKDKQADQNSWDNIPFGCVAMSGNCWWNTNKGSKTTTLSPGQWLCLPGGMSAHFAGGGFVPMRSAGLCELAPLSCSVVCRRVPLRTLKPPPPSLARPLHPSCQKRPFGSAAPEDGRQLVAPRPSTKSRRPHPALVS